MTSISTRILHNLNKFSSKLKTRGSVCSQVARQCAMDGVPVVSGGARGVDRIAMNARKAISSGKLLLLSPYHPKAGFKVGTAMARNKLIYAMADYALVVSAESGQGGIWAGAWEGLKRENSRPVFSEPMKASLPATANSLNWVQWSGLISKIVQTNRNSILS